MQAGKQTIQINGVTIGDGKPYTIAEAGINHNGDIEKAFRMIAVAKKAGVSAIKFQTFKAEEFVADRTQTYTYRSRGKETTESMFEMFKRYEFSKEEWFRIKERCDAELITFLSTPQNESDLELLLDVGIFAIKIGSDDFTNIPLLKKYALKKLPLILSCGMADITEVRQALETVGWLDGAPLVLLVCTSQYPTPPEDANLKRLATLAKEFPSLLLGFSDHTEGTLASSLAVALGAVVFEKHFTLSRDLEGPDHWFSSDPAELSEWVNSIKKSSIMLGSGIVAPSEKELQMRVLSRRSIVAIADITARQIFTTENIGLMRPGNGLPPAMFESLLGKKAQKDVKKGALITAEDFR